MDLQQEEWKNNFEKDDNAFLLDVRTLDEFEKGHIPNASLMDIRESQAFVEGIQSLDISSLAAQRLVGCGPHERTFRHFR